MIVGALVLPPRISVYVTTEKCTATIFGDMPQPSSVTRTSPRPTAVISIEIERAPASMALSASSLTTEAENLPTKGDQGSRRWDDPRRTADLETDLRAPS
jgi:hypothetical protein